MKIFNFFLSLIFSITLFSCQSNKVPVKIHFENLKNISFESGTLTVKETGEIFKITTLKDFEINLPKGKYQFTFKSETNSNVFFPKKINSENQTVRIILGNPENQIIENISTVENIESKIKSGDAKFISFGIAMQDFEKFKEKYKIGLQTNGCVITSGFAKTAKENNQFLANYLTEKYGEIWKKDLPFIPYGLDEI